MRTDEKAINNKIRCITLRVYMLWLKKNSLRIQIYTKVKRTNSQKVIKHSIIELKRKKGF